MTTIFTAETVKAAEAAVWSATCEVSARTVGQVQKWIRTNTGFSDLSDMMCSAIQHNYTPTIAPVCGSAKAYKDAERVANAFDAACTWAFGAGTPRRAYRPHAAMTFTKKVA
jgi:hypothetical protein